MLAVHVISMESDVIKKYKEAGRLWKSATHLAVKNCKEGKNLLTLAHEIEALIAKEGARSAFPINLSINEEAAQNAHPNGDNDEEEDEQPSRMSKAGKRAAPVAAAKRAGASRR